MAEYDTFPGFDLETNNALIEAQIRSMLAAKGIDWDRRVCRWEDPETGTMWFFNPFPWEVI
ncbi:hypothetical protein CCAX7_14310 [Capsulimonas corticalis]|uniref:Uncharacterized protein n=2 Tax=Capsulimonas corticalis TaxID=2219043 RepID=A0A402D735_9BACT|nr:hypothetical protein CCAX7_14310 [Capsulimonas corticalis]